LLGPLPIYPVVLAAREVLQATRTAFPVSPGKHTVRIVTDAYECPPREVEVTRGERLHLLLDFEDFTDSKGRLSPRIAFR